MIILEIYRSPKNKQWYFRLKAGNGKIICDSEGYHRKGSIQKVVNLLKKGEIRVKEL